MRNLRALAVAFLLPIGFLAQAQTKTVAPAPKKLQQLYLSTGTGPAIISDNYYRPHGGSFNISASAGFRSGLILTAGLKHADFVESFSQAPKGIYSYLDQFSYHATYFKAKNVKSYYLSIGKRRNINELIQIQATGGISYNAITALPPVGPDFPRELICDLVFYNKAGALFQAGAMLIPTRFAGLTLGGYYHYIPGNSNFGINLNLNLGLLK